MYALLLLSGKSEFRCNSKFTYFCSQYSSSSSPKRPPISTTSSSFFSSSTTSAFAAAGPAAPAAGAFFAAKTNLVAYGNSYPVLKETASKFLKPFKMECGADAEVAYPEAREILAWMRQAFLNLAMMTSEERSRTAASKRDPAWRTLVTSILYWKG